MDLAKVFDVLHPERHQSQRKRSETGHRKGIRDFRGLAVIVDFTEKPGKEGID